MQPIEFEGYLPDLSSAVSLGGDGARVKIDIPETDVDKFLMLRKLGRNKRIQFVAVVIDNDSPQVD